MSCATENRFGKREFTPEETREKAARVCEQLCLTDAKDAINTCIEGTDNQTLAWVKRAIGTALGMKNEGGRALIYGFVRKYLQEVRDRAAGMLAENNRRTAESLFQGFFQNIRRAQALVGQMRTQNPIECAKTAKEVEKRLNIAVKINWMPWLAIALEKMMDEAEENCVNRLLREDPRLAFISTEESEHRAKSLIDGLTHQIERIRAEAKKVQAVPMENFIKPLLSGLRRRHAKQNADCAIK
jgi:hypothetical protein